MDIDLLGIGVPICATIKGDPGAGRSTHGRKKIACPRHKCQAKYCQIYRLEQTDCIGQCTGYPFQASENYYGGQSLQSLLIW